MTTQETPKLAEHRSNRSIFDVALIGIVAGGVIALHIHQKQLEERIVALERGARRECKRSLKDSTSRTKSNQAVTFDDTPPFVEEDTNVCESSNDAIAMVDANESTVDVMDDVPTTQHPVDEDDDDDEEPPLSAM